MKNNFDFDDYETLKDIKVNNKLFYIVILFMIIGMFLIFNFINIRIYKDQVLFKEEDHYYLYVDFDNDNYINNNNLVIDNINYNYSIINISYENLDGLIYEKVLIDIDSYESDLLISKCNFLLKDDSLLKLVIKYIGGQHE